MLAVSSPTIISSYRTRQQNRLNRLRDYQYKKFSNQILLSTCKESRKNASDLVLLKGNSRADEDEVFERTVQCNALTTDQVFSDKDKRRNCKRKQNSAEEIKRKTQNQYKLKKSPDLSNNELKISKPFDHSTILHDDPQNEFVKREVGIRWSYLGSVLGNHHIREKNQNSKLATGRSLKRQTLDLSGKNRSFQEKTEILKRKNSRRNELKLEPMPPATTVWGLHGIYLPGAPTPPSTPTTPSCPSVDSIQDNLNIADNETAEPNFIGGRKLRSRRYRITARPQKRLFTPDIKRLLKGWLVRRRDNPYPSRSEKEALANTTGLTYMQICNWFANWRRKLRDTGGSDSENSWSHLIRRYNEQATSGENSSAYERFSISSDDSIWAGDEVRSVASPECDTLEPGTDVPFQKELNDYSTESSDPGTCPEHTVGNATGPMYPTYQMEERKNKLFAYNAEHKRISPEGENCETGSALLLSKWLESAARYQPSDCVPTSSYTSAGSWARPLPIDKVRNGREHTTTEMECMHGRHREELDAAEALTFLSNLHFR